MFAMVVAFYGTLFAVALFWEVMKAFYVILFGEKMGTNRVHTMY